jgi:hypothetical protein
MIPSPFQDVIRRRDIEAINDMLLYIEPICPASCSFLLKSHPLLEIFCQSWILTKPLKIVEIGVQPKLKRSVSS